jgi:hypothetical protein
MQVDVLSKQSDIDISRDNNVANEEQAHPGAGQPLGQPLGLVNPKWEGCLESVEHFDTKYEVLLQYFRRFMPRIKMLFPSPAFLCTSD